MAEKSYLAIDLGAESGRTVVGRFDGERITLQETHRFPNVPVRVFDTLHWDILRLWGEIKLGIAASVRTVGKPASMGIDTWGVDFGFVATDGSLLGNPVHYRDSRTEGMLDLAYSIVPKAEIYRQTGLQFMMLNSLYQMLALTRKSKRDPFAQVESLLFIPDLLNYFLTGVKGAEYTIASTSQMLDAQKRTWASDLLRRLAIPESILPPVIPTGKILGPTLTGVSQETGADLVPVVASAGHDTAAAVAGVPASGASWVYISSGTWSLMGAELSQPSITEQGLADNFTNEGGVDGTIRYLKNIMGLWLVQECRRSFERAGKVYDYTTLTRLADEADPFGPIVDPDFVGFTKPADMPTSLRDFCVRTGQTPPSTDGEFIRLCLESLALRYRRTLEQLEKNTGRKFDTIHIVGGGSQNALLNQLTADCTGRPVVAGPIEATSLGNCMVQAMASGEVGSLSQARTIIHDSFPTKTFDPKSRSGWDDAYGRFLAICDRV